MKAILAAVAALIAGPALAADLVIPMTLVDDGGIGRQIGTVTVSESERGLTLKPQLSALPPGPHGFHLHENGDCAAKERDGKPVAALAAGGHYDPDKSGRHEGPEGKGHLGDLPPLQVGADGTASGQIAAPRLKLADVQGRALVIHAGGDNFADQPAPLGGGGARIACGVAK